MTPNTQIWVWQLGCLMMGWHGGGGGGCDGGCGGWGMACTLLGLSLVVWASWLSRGNTVNGRGSCDNACHCWCWHHYHRLDQAPKTPCQGCGVLSGHKGNSPPTPCLETLIGDWYCGGHSTPLTLGYHQWRDQWRSQTWHKCTHIAAQTRHKLSQTCNINNFIILVSLSWHFT